MFFCQSNIEKAWHFDATASLRTLIGLIRTREKELQRSSVRTPLKEGEKDLLFSFSYLSEHKCINTNLTVYTYAYISEQNTEKLLLYGIQNI